MRALHPQPRERHHNKQVLNGIEKVRPKSKYQLVSEDELPRTNDIRVKEDPPDQQQCKIQIAQSHLVVRFCKIDMGLCCSCGDDGDAMKKEDQVAQIGAWNLNPKINFIVAPDRLGNEPQETAQ